MTLIAGVINYCDGNNWQDPKVAIQLGCSVGDIGQIKYLSGDAQVCDGSFWYSILGSAGDTCNITEMGSLTWRGTYKQLQYCDGFNWHVPYIASNPTISSFDVNSGATATNNNLLQTDLSATVSDGRSRLTHFCYKYSTSSTIPTAPNNEDPCWQSYNAPSPGLTPQASLSFSAYSYLLGFVEGTYNVYAWVKSSAGLVSTLSNSGNGTDGVDKQTIDFNPNPPPELVNILSANNDTATFPLTSADKTITSGSSVYIKWHASAISGFGSTPVSLYYTEDEANFTLIANNISNSANTGCTVDGTTFSGCYVWTNGSPTSGYFRIRVVVEDSIGITALNSSTAMNTSTFNVLAGNTDPGLGGSASNAIIFNYVDSIRQDAKSFVFTPDGSYFIRDSVHGIVKIDPLDGLYKQFIPFTGSINDGPIGTATLGNQYARLTLDYDGNLIIYDRTVIRKVDLSTNMVTTVVGGGASVANGSDALSFSLSCISSDGASCPLTVLPNGDMYFLRRTSRSGTPFNGESIWHYDATDNKVYSITPSGTGATGDSSLDISNSQLSGFFLVVDTTNSNIDKFYGAFHKVPCSGCGPRYTPAELNQSTWASVGTGFLSHPGSGFYNQITAMDGKLYMISHASTIYKYNDVSDTWTKLFGSGSTGFCSDGTNALSCDSNIQDAFITSQGKVFFLDQGLLRTIDNSGQVVTIFGQKRNYGDGGLATSARFNVISSIAETTSGKIAMLDAKEHLIREFEAGGTINKLVGNSKTSGITNGGPGMNQPAPGEYWGGRYNIIYDDSNEDLYFYSSQIYRYQRSDGNVYKVISGGSTDFDIADGLIGTDIRVGGYPPALVGFDGSKLLLGSHFWNGSTSERSYLKLYDKDDSYRQSSFSGNSSLSSYPSDGTPVISGSLPSETVHKQAYWDSTTSTWFLGHDNKVRSYPIGGSVGTLATLPRSPSSWTMIKSSSNEWIIYYCASSRIYKYNVTTSTETALVWPSPSIACTSKSIHRSVTRNSIVFPFVQNGLYGIAEIIDTP